MGGIGGKLEGGKDGRSQGIPLQITLPLVHLWL